MKIYVSGSMAYDRIMDFPGKFSDYILPEKIHVLNVCFNVNGIVEKFGGTAGNIAYSLRLLEEKPSIVATIGKDYHAYFEWLRQNEMTTDLIRIIPDELTAGAYITTDKSDNQITGFNPGAMKHPSGYTFEDAKPGEAILHIAPGNLQDMIEYAKICRKQMIPYICDPGQSLSLWEKNNLTEWLDGAMLLISNDYELEIIMRVTGMNKQDLLERVQTVITTLGEKGSLLSTAVSSVDVPAAAVSSVVDPTGAGDAYRAGFLKGIVTGRDMQTAAKIGAVTAAYAVEKYGTQEHTFTYGEFEERYRKNFGELKN